MNTTIERTALTQLVTNEQYARKVLPFIKKDYFSDKTERTVFEEINKFVDKYNKIPTQTSLEIEVSSRRDLNQTEYDKVIEVIKTLKSTDVDFDWLVDTTEKFCKDRAVHNAIVEGIGIIDGKNKKQSIKSMPGVYRYTIDKLNNIVDKAIKNYMIDHPPEVYKAVVKEHEDGSISIGDID